MRGEYYDWYYQARPMTLAICSVGRAFDIVELRMSASALVNAKPLSALGSGLGNSFLMPEVSPPLLGL